MKQVLIIDEESSFKDYIKDKLTTEKIGVETTYNIRDAFTRIMSLLPDVIVLNVTFPYSELIDFLEQKNTNPNSKKIPLILMGKPLESEQQYQLSGYNVIKYFPTPLNMDTFFNALSRQLKTPIPLDPTTCFLETKVNNGIIFIDLAGGMNLDKMAMLKCKISELIQIHKMQNPKVVVIMSALKLCFVDACNLETLIGNILANSHIRQKMVKIVSTDPFTRKFLSGHTEFCEVEMVPSLDRIIFGMVNQLVDTYNPQDLIMETAMALDQKPEEGLFQLRFFSETGQKPTEQAEIPKAKIAIVDNDITTRLALDQAFKAIKMDPELFDNGSAFLNAVGQKVFDAAIIDINLPDISGFDILATLKEIAYSATIIVYSSITQKELVIQALGLGAKSYLVKTSSPVQVVKKTVELINIQHL